MVLGIGAILVMIWYFLKRMRRYRREVERNLGLLSEKDQEINELSNVWKIDEKELSWRRLLDKGKKNLFLFETAFFKVFCNFFSFNRRIR
jgi:hypothetical protein